MTAFLHNFLFILGLLFGVVVFGGILGLGLSSLMDRLPPALVGCILGIVVCAGFAALVTYG